MKVFPKSLWGTADWREFFAIKQQEIDVWVAYFQNHDFNENVVPEYYSTQSELMRYGISLVAADQVSNPKGWEMLKNEFMVFGSGAMRTHYIKILALDKLGISIRGYTCPLNYMWILWESWVDFMLAFEWLSTNNEGKLVDFSKYYDNKVLEYYATRGIIDPEGLDARYDFSEEIWWNGIKFPWKRSKKAQLRELGKAVLVVKQEIAMIQKLTESTEDFYHVGGVRVTFDKYFWNLYKGRIRRLAYFEECRTEILAS